MQSVHTANEDKVNKCSLCRKGFATPNGLKEHKNIHTGERPYMCSYCGANFSNHGNWRMHERTVHLGHNCYTSRKNKLYKHNFAYTLQAIIEYLQGSI